MKNTTHLNHASIAITGHRILFIWILFSILLLTVLFGWQHHMQHKVTHDYTALLGRIYKEDETAGALAAEAILQGTAAADDAALGESVLTKLGYTSDGILQIKGDLFSQDLFFSLVLLGVLVLCCLFGILLAQAFYHTRLAEHESTLQQAQEDTASQRSYMEAQLKQMRQFMENVTHQVKTPLAGLLVTLELADNVVVNIVSGKSVNSENPTDNNGTTAIDTSMGIKHDASANTDLHCLIEDGKKQIARVDRLMNRLLKIGRMEAGKVLFEKTPEDLRNLLLSLPLTPEQKERIHYDLEPVEIAFDHDLNSAEMSFDYDSKSIEMPFDHDWMSEAICCMAEDCLEVSNEVRIQLTADSETICLSIVGDKAPFSAEEADRLFDRFYIPEQSKKSGHYGIGLHFAALVIAGHNGTIHAFSDETGGGFRVIFPRLALKTGKM